ncbi:XRE family transcriptional regulator [Salmonella enterica]|nr:XRE family transcriptional regulator [Salmonella enterica]
MTGYELRLWRKGLGWSSDRAAEELGVCLRSYKAYENADQIKRNIALATVSLTVRSLIPEFDRKRMSGEKIRQLLDVMLRDATHTGGPVA